MKKNIVILGSTGSIGQNTLKILSKYKNQFQVKLLSTNKNLSKIIKQATEFKVKNIIITDFRKFQLAKKKYKKKNFIFYNTFKEIENLFKKKEIYYSMISVIGINGLYPTLRLIKYSKNIAIVNKESLICGWSLIKKKLDYYKTNFLPIDSEHFSIHQVIKNLEINSIKNIYLTASGGPFLKFKNIKNKKIKLNQALNHPNWVMGKKISVDSSTLMNKVFEVIEAKNIFNLPYSKIKILTHPKSYVHGIVEQNNSLIKLIAHQPDMKIPIMNSIFNDNIRIKSKHIDLKILNNLEFKKIDIKQFPLVKILKNLPNYNSLYETAVVTINDFFVMKFLDKKISYHDLIFFIIKFSKKSDILKLKNYPLNNLKEIYKIIDYVSFKLNKLGI